MLVVIFIVFGLVFGSFFSCMGYRIPNKISVIKPNSFCPKCKKELKWYMNIPVFSYLFLGGKCKYCKKKISYMYPLVEVSTAILFALAYLCFGISLNTFLIIVLSSALMITIITDFKYYYVSDRVIVISTLLVVLLRVYFEGLTGFYSLVVGLIIFLLMWLIKIVGDKAFKRESLGGGDVKLMFLVGSSLSSIILSLYSIMIAAFIALPVSLIIMKAKKLDIVAFGPFLIMGALIVLYFNDFFNNIINLLGVI